MIVVLPDPDIAQLRAVAARMENHCERLNRVSRMDIHFQRNLAGAIGGDAKLLLLLVANLEAKLAVRES